MSHSATSYGALDAAPRMISDALEVLREKFSVNASLVELEPFTTDIWQPDASIELTVGDRIHHYLVECKPSIDRKAQIDQVRRQSRSTDLPGLLVAPHITRELADYCRATEMQFIDASGNAYLHAPGFFIFISGEKKQPVRSATRTPKGLTNTSSMRVVFALLARPGLLNSPIKEIAHHAGVSLGAAYNALHDLETRAYLINKGNAGRRKLLEPLRLLEEWTINYPTTLHTRISGQRFSSPDPFWWQDDDLDQFPLAWGSEVAAFKLTGHLKPATQTVYVPRSEMNKVLRFVVKRYRLRPDPQGSIEILEQFWHWETESSPRLAPPLLVYAELCALFDPRAQETARMIREHIIDATFNQE